VEDMSLFPDNYRSIKPLVLGRTDALIDPFTSAEQISRVLLGLGGEGGFLLDGASGSECVIGVVWGAS
jgi:hypothetical protein